MGGRENAAAWALGAFPHGVASTLLATGNEQDVLPQTTPEASRRVVEETAVQIAEELDEDFIVVLPPSWIGQACGDAVELPERLSGRAAGQVHEDGTKAPEVAVPDQPVEAPEPHGPWLEKEPLGVDALQRLLTDGGSRAAVVPTTFESREEREAIRRLLPTLLEAAPNAALMLLLAPPGDEPEAEGALERLAARHEAMLALGCEHVVVNPSREPELLRAALGTARLVAELHGRRVQLALEMEPAEPGPHEVRVLEEARQRLLWVDIVRELLNRMPAIDPQLQETEQSVGRYRFVRRLESRSQAVYEAEVAAASSAASASSSSSEVVRRTGHCVLKVIEKQEVASPAEAECIYREFILTSATLQHPNITRCLEMLHSSERIYLVFEYAGPQSLHGLVAGRPEQRLAVEEALGCFRQVCGALSYCHSRRVAHRGLALRHIVATEGEGEHGIRCILADFRTALVLDSNATSRTRFGSLPYVAPEITARDSYSPKLADRWSLGVVLLEMAGGLTSTAAACGWAPFGELGARDAAEAPWDRGMDPMAEAVAAKQALEYFRQPGSHAAALALLCGVRSQAVVALLEALLQPEPTARAPVGSLL